METQDQYNKDCVRSLLSLQQKREHNVSFTSLQRIGPTLFCQDLGIKLDRKLTILPTLRVTAQEVSNLRLAFKAISWIELGRECDSTRHSHPCLSAFHG